MNIEIKLFKQDEKSGLFVASLRYWNGRDYRVAMGTGGSYNEALYDCSVKLTNMLGEDISFLEEVLSIADIQPPLL